MPKYRQLYTKVLDSDDFNEMPDEFTRVVWLLLPLILDREGRGKNNISWLKSKLFPSRDDSEILIEQLKAAWNWLMGKKMIICYEVEGRFYFYVPTFKTYQKGTEYEAPSSIPEPPNITVSQPSGSLKEDLNQLSTTPSIVSVYESIESPLNDQKIFSIRDAEKAYLQVTQFAAAPGGIFEYLEKILDLLQHYGWEETISRLKAAWNWWRNGKRKDTGIPFDKTNPKWIDYSVTGEIPIAPAQLTEEERTRLELSSMKVRNR